MKNPFLALLGLVAIVALGAVTFWIVSPSRDAGPASVTPAAAAATAGGRKSLAPPAGELAATPERGSPLATAAETRETRSASEAAPSELAAGGERVTVRGRLVVPGPAPADPTLRAVALASELRAAEVYGENGALARLADGGTTAAGAVVDVAGVAADGSFELRFPADTETGWIAVDGRFLYSKRATPVTVADAGAGEVAVRAGLGAWVRGRALLPEGVDASAAAFADMEAELQPDSAQFSMMDRSGLVFTRSTPVDAEGRFELRGIDTGRPYEVEIGHDTLADFTREGIQLEPGATFELEAQLLIGATVRGRVVDESGEPVAAAHVRAFRTVMWGFPGSSLSTAETDDEGRFELIGVPPGRVGVLAALEGKLESPSESLELEDEEVREGVELTLFDGSALTGTVTWPDGRPASEMDVYVSFDPKAMAGASALNAARGASGSATTDADGRYRVTGLGKGPFVVRVTALVDDESWVAFAAGVRPDRKEPLDLVLEPQPVLLGKVVDAAGAPIESFSVLGSSTGGVFWMPGESLEQSFTDEGGEFVVTGLTEGSWRFEVHAEGYGPSAPLEASVPLPAGAARSVFVLEPAATVVGTVVDPDGNSVAGARVTLVVEPGQTFAQATGEIAVPEAFSNDAGAFTLGGLSAGSVTLVAKHDDFAQSEALPLELEGGGTFEGVELRLLRGGVLTGVVYDKEGEPMREGQVFVHDTTNWETILKRTDHAGEFRVDQLRAGDWQVTVVLGTVDPGSSAEGDEGNTSSFFENMRWTVAKVEDGEETHVVLGAPPENPTVVYGQVVHDGEPASNAMVSFFPEGASGFDAMRFQQLDAKGEYEIELDKPGSYLVQVQHYEGAGYQQNNVEFTERIPEGERHRLDLSLPVGRISGRIVGPDGDPLAGARVTLTTDGGIGYGTFMGGQYAESAADESGRFDFEYLRPGEYSVAAGGSVFGGAFGTHAQEGRVVRRGIRVREGEHVEDVDFRLERSGEITGSVTDAAGRPVSGCAIFVRDAGGNLLERFSMISTGPDGKFRYTGVAPGEYRVTARSTEEASVDPRPVRVTAGSPAAVTLTLGPATVLRVQVIDKSGDDVHARVSVLSDDGAQMNGMLAYADLVGGLGEGFSTKEQRVGPLPPGRYEILAVADDGRTTRKPVTLSGQPERWIKVRLKD